jgi:hypothetical protein
MILDRRKLKDLEKNLSQCHFVHHKSQMYCPGVYLGLHCENLATKCLSYDIAIGAYIETLLFISLVVMLKHDEPGIFPIKILLFLFFYFTV